MGAGAKVKPFKMPATALKLLQQVSEHASRDYPLWTVAHASYRKSRSPGTLMLCRNKTSACPFFGCHFHLRGKADGAKSWATKAGSADARQMGEQNG
jgi:hypothetical protein